MVRPLCVILLVGSLCATVVAASPAAGQAPIPNGASTALADPTDPATVVSTAYEKLLGRAPSASELSRYTTPIGRTMTERDLHIRLIGTREFFLDSGGTFRSFVHRIFERAEGRRATRTEILELRDVYRATKSNRRERRRAVATVALSDLRHDVDGLRINLVTVRRTPTGFVSSITVRLNDALDPDTGAAFVAIDGEPVSGTIETTPDGRRLRITPTAPLLTTGPVMAIVADEDRRADRRTQLGAMRGTLFPHIRVVAYYGNHQAAVMGVLGETGPERAAARVRTAANRFHRPERPAVGAFEMIATVAQASAGADGDYSEPSKLDDLQHWIDVARDEGMYVILDIQPGRSDFLTESVRYRDLLLQPHVGLALDPEWRMGPYQRPAQVVGTVTAEEVNAVSAWLSDLVIDNDLPDKMFIVHQFQTRMIQNRDALVDRPGLATIIHADGFGGRAIKLETYSIINVERPFWNGFKLFIDEDYNIFQPADVLGFTTVPVPDLVTYQ